MRVYLIMFLYILMAGAMIRLLAARKTHETDGAYRVSFLAAFAVIMAPLILIGLRTGYNDTGAYIGRFNRIVTDVSWLKDSLENSRGTIWIIYQWIIKRYVSIDSKAFLMITAIIQMLAIVRFYKKYSIDYVYSILLFFFSCSFLYMMGGIRQFAALSVIVFFSDFIFDDKPIRFIVVVIFACFIHVSAIVWLPMVFLIRGKPGNIRMIFAVILVIFILKYLDQFTSILSDTLEGTHYEGYPDQFANDDGSNIMHSFIAAVPVIIWIFGRRQVERAHNRNANILINIAIIGLLTNVLANFTSGILIGRLPIYFTVYNFILLPWLIDTVFEKQSAFVVKMAGIGFYFMYALYYMITTHIVYVSTYLGINAR